MMYLAGFGNYHQTEALPGALPKEQNSPQQCAYGLYAEQLSGTAFTKQRATNMRSWLYRTAPSVVYSDYTAYPHPNFQFELFSLPPNPYRWSTFSEPEVATDFIDGLFHIAGSRLINAYLYQCNQSMHRYFSNHDGELLLVPYTGELALLTEFGRLILHPGMIAVIPRGVRFRMELNTSLAAGYLCENAGSLLNLPNLGVIGANGLASPRHFLYPQAWYEDRQEEAVLITKSNQQFWQARSKHSPLNVVAWHGNYAPYSYDLSLFNTINTVSFDHPDPSIFTVLTAESEIPGVATLDFVIFPPRWMVAEHSFRPPYFHRNIMSELMGLISGTYDAKKEGFSPGGVSIHNCMTPHGPDTETYLAAIDTELKPMRYRNNLAFMFETKDPWQINPKAMQHPARQLDYTACWQNLPMSKLKST